MTTNTRGRPFAEVRPPKTPDRQNHTRNGVGYLTKPSRNRQPKRKWQGGENERPH
jgi:hypothetical protein